MYALLTLLPIFAALFLMSKFKVPPPVSLRFSSLHYRILCRTGKAILHTFCIAICTHEIFLSIFDFFAGILLTKLAVWVYTVITKKR